MCVILNLKVCIFTKKKYQHKMKEIPAFFFLLFFDIFAFFNYLEISGILCMPKFKIYFCKACRYILWSNKLIICGNKIIQPCFSYDTVGFSYDMIRLHQKRYIEDENLLFSLNITMTFWSKHPNCVFSWVFRPKVLGGGLHIIHNCILYKTNYYIYVQLVRIYAIWPMLYLFMLKIHMRIFDLIFEVDSLYCRG